MALAGKVNPDCNYASNPYHECTETCLRRISEGKGRKDRKKSDNGSVYNKRYEDKKGNRVCHRAGNPYHECNENCFGGAGAVRERYKPAGSANDTKSGGKTMNESRSMPPRELDNAPARNTGYNSSVSMPPARLPSPEKTGLSNGDHYSSPEAHLGEIQVEDSPYYEKQLHSSHLEPNHSGDQSRGWEPPTFQKLDENKDIARATGSASGSPGFSFSGVARSVEGSDDNEDSESVASDSSVSVGKYRVKGRLSPILQSIFDKYGDVGASCQLESIAMRSYYLESVCFVVQELQITKVAHLTKSKIKEMQAILKDVESSGIDVGWLRRVLHDNVEAIELIGQHRAVEEAVANCKKDIESARKRLESQMESLALKEKEVEEAKKQIADTRAHLRELELKSSVLIETVSSIESKVENGKSLLDGVL